MKGDFNPFWGKAHQIRDKNRGRTELVRNGYGCGFWVWVYKNAHPLLNPSPPTPQKTKEQDHSLKNNRILNIQPIREWDWVRGGGTKAKA